MRGSGNPAFVGTIAESSTASRPIVIATWASVAAHDVPLPYAPSLEDYVLPQTADVVRAARSLAAY